MTFEDWFYKDETNKHKPVVDFDGTMGVLHNQMEAYIREAYEAGAAHFKRLEKKLQLYEKLEKKLVGMYPDVSGQPFIHTYDKVSPIPEYVTICPAYGVSETYYYKLERVALQEGS